MADSVIPDAELLKYAIDSGMIDTAHVRQIIEMQKRKDLLKKHPYKIYQGATDKLWYTYLPDDNGGRKKIKGATRTKIEDKIIEYWKMQELNPTVESVFYEWIDEKLRLDEIGKATYDRYIIDYTKYFAEISKERIQSIDECYLVMYIKNCIHDFKMTPKAFSNFRTLIYGIFKYAKFKGYISLSITNAIKDMDISSKAFRHIVHRADEQVYMPKEKESMEKYLENNLDIVNLGLLFMFKTGVRVGELATLKRSDVYNYTVAINSTETRFKDENGNVHYEVKDFPKSEAGLRFAILPEKYKWIMDEILNLNPDGEYLFEKDGKRVKTYSFRRKLRYICDSKLHMTSKSPHKVRKTYGSILIDGKVNESTIIDAMGHTDIACTKGHYYFDRTTIEEKRKELGLVQGL